MPTIDEDKVTELVEKINAEISDFQLNSKKACVKAQARRARQSSLRLEKLFKAYRKISIK